MTPTELRQIKERLGVDVTELANRLGISVAHCWQVLNNMRRVPEHVAEAAKRLEERGGG